MRLDRHGRPMRTRLKTLALVAVLAGCGAQPPATGKPASEAPAPAVGSTPQAPAAASAPAPSSLAAPGSSYADTAPAPRPVVSQPAGLVALLHVLLFDGTLAPPRADQVVVLDHDKIASIGPASAFVAKPGVTVLDLSGRAVLPGLVGMHNHLYYIDRAGAAGVAPVPLLPELFYSAPRLYLAGGVTTMRTTGSVEPYADLSLRRMIDAGTIPGPEIDVTAPYLEGPGSPFPQMPAVKNAAEARKFVDFWADQGATSIKAYMNISRDALRAAIQQAHRRGLKVTGHLCSVTYREAAEMGIDDLEHGFFVSTDFVKDKQPDKCPKGGLPSMLLLDPDSAPVRDLIRTLVAHHVAVTSTLPVFEQFIPGRAQDPRAVALLEPTFRTRYLESRARIDGSPDDGWTAAYRDDLKLERAFVQAGGQLLAGPDPTGNGGVLPGFGDQREIELLVEAGFSAVEAIHIATSNGAEYLGRLDRIGTIAAGKQADLVVVRGDPGAHVTDAENVEVVFKKGIGYDPGALIDQTRGTVGLY
jgi:imidazolonepropionase-like amidohydrolase